MYTIDRTLYNNNIVSFDSDSGTKYSIYLSEISPKIWTFNFKLVSGTPDRKEVFKTMGILHDILLEPDGLIERNNIKQIIVFIDGKNRDEIDQKTKIFTRWIKSPWEFVVNYKPEIVIGGVREQIYPDTNIINIIMTNVIQKTIENTNSINTNSINTSNVKFCSNCGSKNNNYKFCPSCGKNLQQE